jgi:hypothetical protein
MISRPDILVRLSMAMENAVTLGANNTAGAFIEK